MNDVNVINIITPTLFIDKKLLDSIESVRGQEILSTDVLVKHFIIIDNSFEDENILKEFCPRKNYEMIVTKLPQIRNGPSRARNEALKNIKKGKIFFLDSDDIWPPNYLETVIQEFKRTQAIAIFVPGFIVENDRLTRRRAQTYLTDGFKRQEILWNCIGSPSGFSYNYDQLKTPVFFNEDLKFFEDWMFYLEILSKSKLSRFYRSNRTFYFYRISPEQATRNIDLKILQSSFKQFKAYELPFHMRERLKILIQLRRLYFGLKYKGSLSLLVKVVFGMLNLNYLFNRILSYAKK